MKRANPLIAIPSLVMALVLMALVVMALPAIAAEYVAGKHYQVLEPQVRTSNPAKIEVTELFWYGCGHCFIFEPLLAKWHETLADDVLLVRSPAIWHPTMELHARAYYTARALGVEDKVHRALFEAMNVKQDKLATEAAIGKVFAAHGVDPEAFTKTFNSFGVASAVRQADARQRSYQTTGTPELVVEGKYRITARMAGGHQGMLEVADHLIALEREQRAKAPAGDSSAAPQ